MSEPKCTITKKNDVWLILDKEKDYKPVRKVGKVNLKKRTFITERYPNHIMKVNNGFGIAHVVLKKLNESNEIDFVAVQYYENLKDRLLRTTVEYYLNNAKYMKFSANDLELQCILPIEQFGLRLAKKWKKEQDKLSDKKIEPVLTGEEKTKL